MRHGKKLNHLGRKSAHRKAMLSNMAASLIEHKRIKTTLAKAKALRVYVEPLITKAKKDTTHSRRVVFSYLQNKEAIKELFGAVAARVGDRPGGYTRILKIGNRLGDNAEMAIIELVDFNELAPGKAPSGGGSRRRRRRKKKSTTRVVEEQSPAVPLTDEVEEEVDLIEEQVEEVEAAVEAVENEVDEAVEEVEEAVSEVETETRSVMEDIVDEVEDEVQELTEEVGDSVEAAAEEAVNEVVDAPEDDQDKD